MRKIKFKKAVWIPLTLIVTGGIIGGGVAIAVSTTNNVKEPSIGTAIIDESSLSILKNIAEPGKASKVNVSRIPGLEIGYSDSNPEIIKLENKIDKAVIQNDILFFIKSLYEDNREKQDNIKMSIEEPKVTYVDETKKTSIIFSITYQNESGFANKVINLGSTTYEIPPKATVNFQYSFGGTVSPTLINNIFGYEIIGTIEENKIEITTNGNPTPFKPKSSYSEPSMSLNTEVIGFSNSIGYDNIKDSVFTQLEKLTAENIWSEIHTVQQNTLHTIIEASGYAQPILTSLASDPTIKVFLATNADNIVNILKLATANTNVPFKNLLPGIIKSILKDETLAQIITNNKKAIIEIVNNVPLLEPFLPQIITILNYSEEELNLFFSKDILVLLSLFGIDNIPGLPELLTRLGSGNEGLLSIITSPQGIKLLAILFDLLPGFSQSAIVIDLLNILSLGEIPKNGIMNQKILDTLIKVIKSEQTTIASKTPSILINNTVQIAALKNNLNTKNPFELAKFFDNVLVGQEKPTLSPYFERISVTTTPIMSEGKNPKEIGFNINLSSTGSNLYFVGGIQKITSKVTFGAKEVLGDSKPSLGINGNLLETLLQSLIPGLNEMTMNLLPQILYNNPNITKAKLQAFLVSLSSPQVDGVTGTYVNFLQSMKVTRTESAGSNYDNKTRDLNGTTTTKYVFTKTIKISLKGIYGILPPNLNLNGTSIPVSLLTAQLPNFLFFHKDDYISVGQKFNSPISFQVIDLNEKKVARWQAPSVTIIDLNMPQTIKSIRAEYSGFGGNILWATLAPLFEKILPNTLYSIKESTSHYSSFANINIEGLENYSPNIFNGASFIANYTPKQLTTLKAEIKTNSVNNIIAGSEIAINSRWTISKQQTGLKADYDLNASVMKLFNIIPDYNGIMPIANISYDEIKFLDQTSILGISIPEFSITSLKVLFNQNIYNGNQTGTKFQKSWIL